MRMLIAVTLLLVACGKDAAGPAPLAGDFCLSSWNYRLVTETGDTLRTTGGGGTYGGAVCMTFSDNFVTIAPYPPDTPTYADAEVISNGQTATGSIYVWYGNRVKARVFRDGNQIFLSDADGDLYWLALSGTEIRVNGRVVTTALVVRQNGLSADLTSEWVQR